MQAPPSSITVKLHANQEIGVPGQSCWGGGNKKSGRRAAAVREIPHFYLLRIVTKGGGQSRIFAAAHVTSLEGVQVRLSENKTHVTGRRGGFRNSSRLSAEGWPW